MKPTNARLPIRLKTYILTILLGFSGGLSLLGQSLTQTQINDGTETITRFSVNLPGLPGSELYKNSPYYRVFIEYGDEHFNQISSPSAEGATTVVFDHRYSSKPPQRPPRVRVTPIYSQNDEPPSLTMLSGNTNITNLSGFPQESYFQGFPASTLVHPYLSWNVLVPGDTFTVAIAYRSDQQIPSPAGTISLYYHEDFVSPVEGSLRSYNNEEAGTPIEPDDILANPRYTAKETYSSSSMDNGTFNIMFVDMVINEELPLEEEGTLNTYVKLGYAFPGAAGGPPSQVSESGDVRIKIQKGRDPNNMVAFPKPICENDPPTVLTYTINFENAGNGPVKDIQVEATLDDQLDREALTVKEIVIGGTEIISPQKNPSVFNPAQVEWTFTSDASGFLLVGAQEEGVDVAMKEIGSRGHITFEISPKAGVSFADCSSFSSLAEIRFTNIDTLQTEAEVVDCVDCKDDETAGSGSNDDNTGGGTGPGGMSDGMIILIAFLVLLLILLIVFMLRSRKK
ncbi:MAG: hypothetical protein AAFR61_18030 [Bacteroidota bacterium]